MNVKGTRDFLPEEMILRQQVLEKIKCTFDTFGFQPTETPALESWEVLSAKGAGGEDVFKECYNFEDLGGRRIGLRYEITVSLARMISENPNLPLPFKSYQMGKIWRYGEVARGRLREFMQCDADIIGSESPLADAEVIACAVKCFESLGFNNFYIRLNNRKTLNNILKNSKVEEDRFIDVLRSIDKLDKIGVKEVEKELSSKGIPDAPIKKVIESISTKGSNDKILEEAKSLDGINDIKEIVSYLKFMGVDSKVKIDLSLTRGLDYYTGPVFEVFAEEGIGSIAGGGRYDKMIGLFSGKDIPATGISLGIERIVEVIKERKLLETAKNKTKVFVIAVNDKVRGDVLGIVQKLRQDSVSADYDLRSRTLSKQLEYASALGIPFAAIVGERELKEKSVKLRDMKSGKEEMVKISDICKRF